MAKHEKEKNLLGELLLETKTRGGGLQLIGWRFCDGPPFSLSLSYVCCYFFCSFFSLYITLSGPIQFFLSLCFFFLWLVGSTTCYEGKPKFHCWSSKGKPKMPLVPPPPPLSMFFVRHPLYPAVFPKMRKKWFSRG